MVLATDDDRIAVAADAIVVNIQGYAFIFRVPVFRMCVVGKGYLTPCQTTRRILYIGGT